MAAKVEPFWKRKTLAQLDQDEWESLCDGCGLCCLQKLEDEDDGSVYYTRIACKLLDLQSCRCTNYAERIRFVPDCIQLTPAQADEFQWLPPTCGYRLVAEGRTCRSGTTWSAATRSGSTRNAFPSPGACSARPRWPRTTGRTT